MHALLYLCTIMNVTRATFECSCHMKPFKYMSYMFVRINNSIWITLAIVMCYHSMCYLTNSVVNNIKYCVHAMYMFQCVCFIVGCVCIIIMCVCVLPAYCLLKMLLDVTKYTYLPFFLSLRRISSDKRSAVILSFKSNRSIHYFDCQVELFCICALVLSFTCT